jgi:hypothetical protein
VFSFLCWFFFFFFLVIVEYAVLTGRAGVRRCTCCRKEHEEQHGVCVIPDYADEHAEEVSPASSYRLEDELAGQMDWSPVSHDPEVELPWAEAVPVDLTPYKDAEEAMLAAATGSSPGLAGSSSGLNEDDRDMLSQVNTKLDLVLSRLQTLEIKLTMIESRIVK